MTLTEEEVSTRYPIHWLVWNNEHEELKASLKANKFTAEDIELKDPRGRTPLLLAVTLGQTRTSRALIEAGADINCEKDGWTAVQEATATGNPKLLSLVLSHRDYQRHLVRSGGIPDLLQRLSLAPDFYVEMKWEFTSWVPLVSRMCPFDTYKVYKRGGNVRVDTTLVGFENNRWQRGDRTYIFRGHGQSASLVELDHVARSAWLERVGPSCARSASRPSRSVLRQRLTAPLALNYLDTDKISFERNKCGIWGWRQDKTEEVNGYECKVFSANNVEVVSATRTEHLSGGARRALVRGPAPLAGLLALADAGPDAAAHAATHAAADSTPDTTPDAEETNGEQSDSGSYGSSIQDTDSENSPEKDIQSSTVLATLNDTSIIWAVIRREKSISLGRHLMMFVEACSYVKYWSPSHTKHYDEEGPSRRPPPPPSMSWQQYFGAPDSSDIGRPRELTTKVQKFRATLWLCENYPLELQEQIMPILDLMAAISSPHFAKLKDFIQMQLPAGFPVKIEIPLFHVLNARITFGNIFATESPVPYIESIHEGERLSCVVDDLCFNVGAGYKDAASCEDRLACAGDEDEGLLQYAIQQSLMDPGTHDDQVDVWEALRGARPASPAPPRPADLMDHEETQLQRAIEASLASLVLPREAELSAALEQSAREQLEAARLLQDEQRALDEAIRASMLDH